MVKDDVFIWQAWNPYGGYGFYVGKGHCPPGHYPLCSRARVVSFDRPYGAEDGSGNFLKLEYPLVRWAEKHGLDVTYATDLTVQQHPGYLLHHKALLSLGHDECWALKERQAAVRAHKDGVNIVFFAASPILRHVRVQPSPLGPGREEVDYRNSAEDPLDGKGNYTDPKSGARVLDTGTNNWIPALDDHDGCGRRSRSGGICAEQAVRRITGNILRVFGQGPAGKTHPSVANWRQVTGQ